MSDLATVLRGARERLAEVGSPSPRAEAERLAARVLDTTWGGLWSRMSDPLDETDARAFERALSRRLDGEPVAYIEGTAPFFGMEIACGPGVLVPRPETETLARAGLELIADVDDPVVVDIGTGTGCVALALARERDDARIWATDLSREALEWARRNTRRYAPRVRLAHGDLFGALPEALRGRIDLVVSNPPYVPDGTDLPREVCAEPRQALRGGQRGDEVLLRIAHGAPGWLGPRGAIALEVGTADQARGVERALCGFGSTGVGEDLGGRPRVVWGRR